MERGREGERERWREGERLTPSCIEQIKGNQREEREGQKKGEYARARGSRGREGQAQRAGSAPPLEPPAAPRRLDLGTPASESEFWFVKPQT